MFQPFRLFISYFGRIHRGTFLWSLALLLTLFFNIKLLLNFVGIEKATYLLCIPLLWSFYAVSAKRYHDLEKSSWNLLALAIPLLGPIWVFGELAFKKGKLGPNKYGIALEDERLDYYQNPNILETQTVGENPVVNDVTQINPISVAKVLRPHSIEEIVDLMKTTKDAVSIGGGRFSMGGQTASPNTTHLDMRSLNRVVSFFPEKKIIRVQTGIRWCDIQRFIDPHHLSVKIMQTYANFTVGGSLSVNVHGRYIGQGPLILSVRAIKLVMANGDLIEATPQQNSEIFFAAIGGYGGIGIIVEAELSLADNIRVERRSDKMMRSQYHNYFKQKISGNHEAIFHNADMYPPHYERLRAVTWWKTDAETTVPHRLMPIFKIYPIHRYFYWAFSETPLGKWRREFIIEPILFLFRAVHWRNYEAGYDVTELEPSSRKQRTYVLQEYFVPIDKFDEFVPLMGEIFRRHKVNIINISVRHAVSDSGSMLAWAREEVFAFVVYYKQRVRDNAKNRVAVWTREMIDAVISVNGAYYLPYQIHATKEQFHAAYPRAKEFFALKKQVDPDYRLRNALWDAYYAPTIKD